jgi:hypothetical protein
MAATGKIARSGGHPATGLPDDARHRVKLPNSATAQQRNSAAPCHRRDLKRDCIGVQFLLAVCLCTVG